VFSLYRKINAADMTPLAILEVSVDLDTLLNVDRNGENFSICIWEDGSGVILSENDPGGMLREHIPAIAAFGGETPDSVTLRDGSRYYLSSIAVEEPALRVYLGYPYALINSEADDNTRIVFSFVGFGAMLVGIYLVTAFHSLPRRLSRLVVRMESIHNRCWDIDIAPDGGDERKDDEIAQINRSLCRLVEAAYSAEMAEKEAKLSYLQAQLNPHFLFNALESIRMAATLGQNEQVADALLDLSRILRARLHSDEMITLESEIAIIRSYINVENIRFGGRIDLNVSIVPLSLWMRRLPPLLIQPLAENAVKHGMRPDRRPLLIKLRVTESPDGGLSVSMADDGTGMEEGQLSEVQRSIRENRPVSGAAGNGVGLNNLAQRLRLYYGESARLILHSIHGVGTQAEYSLPPENRRKEDYLNKKSN
jgi:two-component system sensor histidine kinase YesM